MARPGHLRDARFALYGLGNMADVQQQLARLLADFTGKVTALASKAAVESARAALDGGRREAATRATGRRAAATTTASRPAVRKPGVLDNDPRGEQLVSYLLGRPGQRMDQLAGVFRRPTAKMAIVVKKLVAQRLVRFEGNTRGRRYYAAGGATSSTGRKTAKARRRGARAAS
jgi:hypothetical protein